MKRKNKTDEEELKKPKILVFDIPNELVHVIVSYLEPKSVLVASLVNKIWYQICFSDIYWKPIFIKTFEDTHNFIGDTKEYNCLFKDVYKKKNFTDVTNQQTTTSIYQPLQLLYHIKPTHGGFYQFRVPTLYFFDQKIYFYFDQKVFCLSKKNFKEIWTIELPNVMNMVLDELTETLICSLKPDGFIILSLTGKEIGKFGFEKDERIIAFYKVNDIIIYYSRSERRGYLTGYTAFCEKLWRIELVDFIKDELIMYFYKNKLYFDNYGEWDENTEMLCVEFENLRKSPKHHLISFHGIKNTANFMFFIDKLYFISINEEDDNEEEKMMYLDLNSEKINLVKTYSKQIFNVRLFQNPNSKNIIEKYQVMDSQHINLYDGNFIFKKSISFDGNIGSIYFTNDNNIMMNANHNYNFVFTDDLEIIEIYSLLDYEFRYANIQFYDDLLIATEMEQIRIFKGSKKHLEENNLKLVE